MENTNKLYECSECCKTLQPHPNSPILSFYKPMISGKTIKYEPIGYQCSEKCYNEASIKRHMTEANTIINNWKKNKKE
jgi:hypothetical protein